MLTKSKEETIELGKKVGELLEAGSVLILKGDLASGKTTFTKGIGKALNIKEIINSPTFTILKIYHGDKILYHIDAYRLENSTYDLGFDELEDDGIMVIEWPEYFINFLPKDFLEINFDYIDENVREIKFNTSSNKYKNIIEKILC